MYTVIVLTSTNGYQVSQFLDYGTALNTYWSGVHSNGGAVCMLYDPSGFAMMRNV